MKYESNLTKEQKRSYMTDFEAFLEKNETLAPGEALAVYYRDVLEYTNTDAAKRLNRSANALSQQYKRAKIKN